MHLLLRAWPLLLALLAPLLHAQPAPPAPPADTAYPGTLTLQVDATDLAHRIFRVRETLPAQPGPLTLYYPRWIPGTHAPSGTVVALAGLVIRAAGQPVAWRRDPLDVHAFRIEVPAGAAALEIEFQFLSPVNGDSGRVVATPDMLNVQWNAVLLYPAGHADARITMAPSLRLPDGWAYGTALEATAQRGGWVEFKPVSLETLIDSPVYSGRHLTRVDLDPQATEAGRAPVHLTVMADVPAELTISPEQLTAHRALVTQADRLFGTRHFARYEFLLAISDRLGGIGLEHHQSSENGLDPGYFSEWAKASTGRDLLAHEFVHSWNGKFRRPADLWTPNTNLPMQDSLLWLYEGQTQFWGNVLAARAGLVPLADTLDGFANTAASLESEAGRVWRDLQDTTNQGVIADQNTHLDWRDWQREHAYYDETAMVWLEADMLIREASAGARSLDDFAHAFFGVEPGRVSPLLYGFDDAVIALNGVQPYDWATFLRTRLQSHAKAPLDGLARAGWRLGWSEEPNNALKGRMAQREFEDFGYSLGIEIGKEGRLRDVRWASPAYAAGLSTAASLIAVDGVAYKAERLKASITAAKTGKAPIQLLVKDGDFYKTVSIPYHGGLRYPKLERIDGTTDRLTPLLTARP
jgi:predicted metalloprotease with PDZ domain